MDIQKLNPWNWFSDEEHKNELWDNTKQSYRQSVDYMQKELDKLKENMMSAGSTIPSLWQPAGESSTILRPRVDIAENSTQYTISVETPGVKEEDITLEVDDRNLCISGEKRQSSEVQEDDFHRIERSYGKFKRVLTLPDDAEADKAKATFEDGVVTIVLTRKQQPKSKSKTIEIKKAA